MRDIIVKTTAASGQRDGAIRYWLSSGPGSLELSPAAGARARLLRDDLRAACRIRSVGTPRACG